MNEYYESGVMRKVGAYIHLSRAAVSSTVANRSLRICSSCARFALPSLSLLPYPPFGFGVLCDVVADTSSIVNSRYEQTLLLPICRDKNTNITTIVLKVKHTILQTFPIVLRQALPSFPTLSLCFCLASTSEIQIFLYACCRSQHTAPIHVHLWRC